MFTYRAWIIYPPQYRQTSKIHYIKKKTRNESKWYIAKKMAYMFSEKNLPATPSPKSSLGQQFFVCRLSRVSSFAGMPSSLAFWLSAFCWQHSKLSKETSLVSLGIPLGMLPFFAWWKSKNIGWCPNFDNKNTVFCCIIQKFNCIYATMSPLYHKRNPSAWLHSLNLCETIVWTLSHFNPSIFRWPFNVVMFAFLRATWLIIGLEETTSRLGEVCLEMFGASIVSNSVLHLRSSVLNIQRNYNKHLETKAKKTKSLPIFTSKFF